jgi:uncharacterized protein YggE
MSVTFKNDRTDAVVRKARQAANFGAHQRAIDLLAEADGLEAWAGANSGSVSRNAIAATIKHIRGAERAAERARAAEALAAEFGTDVNEWTV